MAAVSWAEVPHNQTQVTDNGTAVFSSSNPVGTMPIDKQLLKASVCISLFVWIYPQYAIVDS